jgi:nucleoside-diphosphate-sugar epimerase
VNILIVGASGNLGSHLTRYLLATPHRLRLLVHKRALPFALPERSNTELVRGDLNDPASLTGICQDIDCVVYLAGVLFQPQPEKFLHRTNTVYVRNIVDAALSAGVRKFILVSFPHVEENTTPQAPARGLLDVYPKSIHARTRLAAEKHLFDGCAEGAMTAVVLRAGVIYGREVKLIEAAIWRQPTWVHLLALADFLKAVEISIASNHVAGIYNLGDDQPILLQEFLDRLAVYWDCAKPWRLPNFAFHAAALISEIVATILRTAAPLTRDIVRMGMTSVVADTTRMKRELTPTLIYPTLAEGLDSL